MHVVVIIFVQKILLKRNNFKEVSDSQIMYVLKAIRIFFVFLEICSIYPNIQKRVKAKKRLKPWKHLGGFHILCGALEDLHMQRSDTSKIISKLFLTVQLYPKNKVSINCFKGKSEHKESFSTWKKCLTEQKFLRIPDASPWIPQAANTSFPLGMSLVVLCVIPSLLGAWPHKSQPLPIPWHLFTGRIYFMCRLCTSHTNSSQPAEYQGCLQYSIKILNNNIQ